MEKNKSILNFLKEYDMKNSFRFHMPGHKGKNMEELKSIFPSGDITEIYGSDNLHYPEGIIEESQKKASKLFGSEETLFVVNGSTASIYSSITGTLFPGEKLLMQRDSHKAAYNASILGSIETEYINPIYSQELGLCLGVDPASIKMKLAEDDNIKAVFLTYPSYYGVCSDIEEIAKIVREYDRILIVDEAHGSHLRFSESLPKSSTDLGADIVIQSTHKTLSGFTQTSMLHICTDRVDAERIKTMARIYQSSSPSYLLLSSLDWTVDLMMEKGKELMDQHLKAIDLYYYEKNMENKSILTIEKLKSLGYGFDKTKLVFSAKGYSGKELEDVLRNEYNIELEMSDSKYGVAITSIFDSESDIEYLANALIEIESREEKNTASVDIFKTAPEKIMSLREAFYSEKEIIELQRTVGRVSGSMIVPYPPGVPVLAPGEKIDDKILKYIQLCLENGIAVQGIEDGKIKVLQESNK